MRRLLLSCLVLLASATFSFAKTQCEAVLDSVKIIYKVNKSLTIGDLSISENDTQVVLKGKTNSEELKASVLASLTAMGKVVTDSVTLLKSVWGLPNTAYVHMRSTPAHAGELGDQCLMGNPVKIWEDNGNGWLRIQTADGYISWATKNSIVVLSDSEFDAWRSAERYVVTSKFPTLLDAPNDKESDEVSDLVLGDILVGSKHNKNWVKLTTPDGRVGYIQAEKVEEIKKWASQPFDAKKITKIAKKMMGATYTWGGTSTKAVDCSGLTKTCYFSNAIIIMRDANQQVLYGGKIAPKDWKKAQRGDLLYFGTESGRVTHTAIYVKDGKYIHASGMGRVMVSSLDPSSELYLNTPFISINRINGYVGTAGIAPVKNHPWYFIVNE